MGTNTPQQTTSADYVPAIDGLRALAVSAVVIFHLWSSALPGGFTGVDIFFVISGFVVTRSVLGKRFDTMRSFLAWFYARRLVRIMPALLAMLLVTILATQLFVPTSWLSNSIPVVGTAAFFGLSNILLATDTDSYFGPQAGYNPFTHTWSLGVEEQFYLLFPLLLFPLLRSGGDPLRHKLLVRRVLLLSIASLLIAAWLPQRYAFYLILSRFWELGAGMLLCLTLPRWQAWVTAAPLRTPFTLAGIALVAAGLAIPESPRFPFPLALLPVLGTTLLIALVATLPTAPLTRLFSLKPVVWLGLLSYSLYLWHWPVFVLFRWTTGLQTLPLQLTALAIAVALSILSYRLLEQPLRASPRIAAMPRGRVAGRMAFATIGCALLGVGLFAAHDRVTLSVTRDHAVWYPDNRRPLSGPCRVTERVERLSGGSLTSWTPEGCRPAPFALHAIGDSHNLAYTPAYRRLAAEQGITVRAWFRAGCPTLKLIDPDPPRCAAWFAAQDASLAAHAGPGDVLFFPALRLTRFTNQFENDPALANRRGDSVLPEQLRAGQELLQRQAERGLRMVLEAPKPIFRSPPVRCADWFNRANPICAGGLAVSREELERRRAPVMGAMAMLTFSAPEVAVWDPFPTLCPATPCRALEENGRPRFLDGDHLSGHGNDVIYPGLRAAILAAARR
jgi:peptidoglycan/LPS O-acetylase OafA/YrhL